MCAITFLLMIDKFVPLIAYIVGDHKAYLWASKEKAATGLNMLRIIVSRYMPLMFIIFITYINRNALFKELYGKNMPRGVGMFFKDTSSKIVKGYTQLYDMTINRSLFISIYYISLFAILEITIASDYERMTRLSLLLCAILFSRQLHYLTGTNKKVAYILLLLLFVLYFVSIMFFMSAKHAGSLYIYIDYVFRMVMDNNSLF